MKMTNLQKRRLELGKTARQIAEFLDVTEGYISKVENFKLPLAVKHMKNLSRHLKMPLKELKEDWINYQAQRLEKDLGEYL